FATLVAANLGLVLVNRSHRASVLAAFSRSNPALWSVVVATAGILAAVVLIPPARDLFHFGPLHGHDIAVALVGGAAVLLLLETPKKVFHPLRGAAFRPARTAGW